MTTSERQNVHYGNEQLALDGEILRTVVGSQVHGINLEGTDDQDLMGIYVEPPENVIGVAGPEPHFISRTQPEGERSGPGDIDLTMYSLRKYMDLAIKGNPTVLLPLYAPESFVERLSPLGVNLRGLASSFLSRAAVKRFLGYMDAQHQRMLGQSKRNVPNRPELIEKYGWDTKYGSHALRLAYQGYEVAFTGKLTLPLSEKYRQRVLDVKQGKVKKEEVSEQIEALRSSVQDALSPTGTLAVPDEPDWDALNNFSIYAHQRFWEQGSQAYNPR